MIGELGTKELKKVYDAVFADLHEQLKWSAEIKQEEANKDILILAFCLQNMEETEDDF